MHPKISRIGHLVVLLLLGNSCTVYYQTSTIDNELNQSVQTATTNSNQLIQQVTELKKTYTALNCLQQTEPFKSANGYLLEIDASTEQLLQLQTSIQKGYAHFQTYSSGKTKIASNTPEWKQLKSTKKAMKSDFKSLKKLGNATVKKAEKFNAYITEKIVPIVTKVTVKEFLSSFDASKRSLQQAEQQLAQQIHSLELQLGVVQDQLGPKNTLAMDSLRLDFNQFKAFQLRFSAFSDQLNRAKKQFEQQTQGMTILYSCTMEWEIVESAEKSLVAIQRDFAQMQQEMNLLFAHMQGIINRKKQ
jgi:hypothetical protein